MSQLSPGVLITETDLSSIAPSQSPVAGGFVGEFSWGPINQPVLISSESEQIQLFGKPTSRNAKHFFGLASYLNYSRTCQVVRVAHVDSGSNTNGAKNATSSGSGLLIKNKEAYDAAREGGGLSSAGSFLAKWAGKLGNSIKVEVCDENRIRLIFTTPYTSSDDYTVGENVTQVINEEVATAIVDSWTPASIGQAGSILNLRQVSGNFQPSDDSDYTAWTISTAYDVGDIIRPATANGFAYEVTTAGTSHTSAPTFPTTIGGSVTDGAGVVYRCITQYGILGETSSNFYHEVNQVINLFENWQYSTSFDGPPGTSSYAA
jgi:hypothetical protein